MRNEKRERPPLDSKRKARSCSRTSVRETNVERLAEERVVQIEGRRCSRAIRAEWKKQLVLELSHLLKELLRTSRWSEERITRLGDRRVETEVDCKPRRTPDRALEKCARIRLTSDADNLAHRERPSSLERLMTLAFVTPAPGLCGDQLPIGNHLPRERGVNVIADCRVERDIWRHRRFENGGRGIVMLSDVLQHILVPAQVRRKRQPLRQRCEILGACKRREIDRRWHPPLI
jgi:hypothetical protein